MDDRERRRRWRMALGPDAGAALGARLAGPDAKRDAALNALYGRGPDGPETGTRDLSARRGPRTGGLGRSAPGVARWLGDIRTYFPASVVRVMQRDAMDRLGLRQLLLEPELLSAVQPDVALVAALVSLSRVIPDRSRETARSVVGQVTSELERRLATPTRAAVSGALRRSARTRRPRPADIDWDRTIRENLRHYRPELRTVIPEHLVGHGRRGRAVEREIILALDQSGSMSDSIVYAGVLGSVLAGIPSLRTSVVAFDTDVADLTAHLSDPVDLLFATQLGGGTDINRAVAYCAGLVTRPADTIVVLISDLVEGGLRDELVARMAALVEAGAVVVVLLALSDEGAPAYDHGLASALASVGVAAFACTPDRFPDLMAAAVERRDLARWAGDHGLGLASPVRRSPAQ